MKQTMSDRKIAVVGMSSHDEVHETGQTGQTGLHNADEIERCALVSYDTRDMSGARDVPGTVDDEIYCSDDEI